MGQLVDAGVPASTVRNWVAIGRLVRLHQNVFAVGHRALRREGHWLAAVLACGPQAVLSHRSAAALWNLRSSAANRLDVTVASRAGRTRLGLRVHDGCRLAADEVTESEAIPCTTVARTLLDLATVLDQRGLERACEQAERIELFDLWAITRLLKRHRGRRGTARLQRVLAEWDPDLMRTRSELEVLFHRLLSRADIARPLVNVRIELTDRVAPEMDFHWPARRVAVETDSKAFHSSPIARGADARRDQALRQAGWRVARFSHADVVLNPERTVARLRRLLATPVSSATG